MARRRLFFFCYPSITHTLAGPKKKATGLAGIFGSFDFDGVDASIPSKDGVGRWGVQGGWLFICSLIWRKRVVDDERVGVDFFNDIFRGGKEECMYSQFVDELCGLGWGEFVRRYPVSECTCIVYILVEGGYLLIAQSRTHSLEKGHSCSFVSIVKQ